MTKLLNKYKEIKRTKKGFTLVELLVVIAILAVLASVSVVGYLGFTTKARNSNAMTELAQVREVIRAELIDGDTYTYTNKSGETTKYSAAYQYKDGNYYFTFTCSETATVEYTYNNVFEASFTDLAGLGGTYYVTFGKSKAKNADSYSELTTQPTSVISETTYTIATIGLKNKEGGYALWTIDGDKLDTSDKTTVEGGQPTCFKVTAGS